MNHQLNSSASSNTKLVRQVSGILTSTTKINEVVKLRRRIKSQMEGSYTTLAERSAKKKTGRLRLVEESAERGMLRLHQPCTCCNEGSAISSTYAALSNKHMYII